MRRFSDRALVGMASAILFLLAAWPIALARIPPLEDLPAHLATAAVIRHLDAYPEFVFHGFFKTNSTLFAFLHFFGGSPQSLVFGSKVFVLLTLAAHAWVFPRLVLELGGRERVPAATLLAAPLVHNWFVAMGMLDYALASALALAALLLVARQHRAPTSPRAVALGLVGILVWYTHVFALGLLCVVLAFDALVRRRDARVCPSGCRPALRILRHSTCPSGCRPALRILIPLAPSVALSAWSVVTELWRPHGAVHALVYRPVWETAYELWAKYAWAFTRAEIASVVAFAVLAWSLYRERSRAVPLLSNGCALVLLGLHFALPSEMLDWFAVGTRTLPFLYAAALVRAPTELPRWLWGTLGASAALVSIGLGFDYRRLGAELDELAAGESVVPVHADLLPLIFDPKGSSENTWALVNGWGLYVVDENVRAPLLFAHSPSFPLGYRIPPTEPMRLGELAPQSSPTKLAEIAELAAPHAWILTYGGDFAPPEHALRFERGRLRIFGPRP